MTRGIGLVFTILISVTMILLYFYGFVNINSRPNEQSMRPTKAKLALKINKDSDR